MERLAEAAWRRNFAHVQPEDWNDEALLAISRLASEPTQRVILYNKGDPDANGMRTIDVITASGDTENVPRHAWSKTVLLANHKDNATLLTLAAKGLLHLVEHVPFTRDELMCYIPQTDSRPNNLLSVAHFHNRLHEIPPKLIAIVFDDYKETLQSHHLDPDKRQTAQMRLIAAAQVRLQTAPKQHASQRS